jgi:hypothetical protein
MSFIAALSVAVLLGGGLHEDNALRPDSVLLSVELSSTAEKIIVEGIAQDSTLLLAAGPVYQLLGLGLPPTPWVSLTELQAAYPSVAFIWSPQEMRVLILDRMEVLPASRRAKAEIVARSQAAFSLPVQSAPFAALAVDDSLHGVFDAGYSYRGQAAVAGRVDDAGTASWGATVAPNSHVFVTYTDAVARPPTMSGRIAAGPLWLATTYTPRSPLDLSGLLRIKDAEFYASRDYGVLTINQPHQLAVQLATNWKQHRTAARVSVGPSFASPFAFPVTTLTPKR